MGRLKTGFTLTELLTAMALLVIVVMAGSAFLVSFYRLYFNPGDVEVMSTAVFNEISNRLNPANRADVTGEEIDIYVDEANTPSAPGDDTRYSYWRDDGTDTLRFQINGSGPVRTIAQGIEAVSFVITDKNTVTMTMTTRLSTDPAAQQKTYRSVVVMRSSPAQ